MKRAAAASKKRTSGKKRAARSAGKNDAGSHGARAPARKKAARRRARRADLGAPVDDFFVQQPPELRAILEELRRLVGEELPGAQASIRWGNPFYSLDGAPVCALSAHKAHVNLILAGPPGSFDDPEGKLSGEGKTGRHLKLTRLDQVPRQQVRGWLRTAAEIAARS